MIGPAGHNRTDRLQYSCKPIVSKGRSRRIINIVCCKWRAGAHYHATVYISCTAGYAIIYGVYRYRYMSARNKCYIFSAGNAGTGNKKGKCIIVRAAYRIFILFRAKYILKLQGVSIRYNIKFKVAGINCGTSSQNIQHGISREAVISAREV